MADIAKRFYGPALLTNAAATLFTVDVDHRAHVTHIQVVNNDTVDVDFTWSFGLDAPATRKTVTLAANGGWWDDTGLHVIEAGDLIQAYASVTDVVSIEINGVETTTR